MGANNVVKMICYAYILIQAHFTHIYLHMYSIQAISKLLFSLKERERKTGFWGYQALLCVCLCVYVHTFEPADCFYEVWYTYCVFIARPIAVLH